MTAFPCATRLLSLAATLLLGAALSGCIVVTPRGHHHGWRPGVVVAAPPVIYPGGGPRDDWDHGRNDGRWGNRR